MNVLLIMLVLALLAIIGALSYACYNLLRKIEIYENWVNTFRKESDDLYQRLKIVDEKNLFEKDDDVGFVFSEILRIVKEFNEQVK